MNDPKKLSSDLLTACKSFFDKYNFEVRIDKGDELIVGNPFCVLRFVIDWRHDSGTSFRPNNSRHSFSLFEISHFLMPSETIKFLDNPEYKHLVDTRNVVLSTKLDLDFFDRHLPHVLKGDISWMPALIADSNYQRKLVEFVFNNLDPDHPIKKQFFSGDSSWRQNLEVHLKENKINISLETKPRWKFW